MVQRNLIKTNMTYLLYGNGKSIQGISEKIFDSNYFYSSAILSLKILKFMIQIRFELKLDLSSVRFEYVRILLLMFKIYLSNI